MSRPAKTPYKTTNWHSYNQALRQRGSLTVWFDPSMQWEAAPSGRRGRQQAYSDAAIQACLTIKVLLGLPLRQTTGFVASLLELSGLGWAVPDFSPLSRRQKTLEAGHGRSSRTQRDPASIEAPGPGTLAELERVSAHGLCWVACQTWNGCSGTGAMTPTGSETR